MLKFNSQTELATVLDKLEADYETYNSNYENQFPSYTADQLDYQDSISNFNEWQTVENFENLFTGFSSKGKLLFTQESNWLNVATDLTENTDSDSTDYTSDYFYNAVANINNKLIVGSDTYQSYSDGLYLNGIKIEDEGSSARIASKVAGGGTQATLVLCNYCDTCRNWQRSSGWSVVYNDDQGRQWKFKKVIAVRGISIDGRGHVKATVKARRKSGSKWKRKRAYLGLQMLGTVYSNKCQQETVINSGVYQSSRPRNHMRKQYAAVGNKFFRTKSGKIGGVFQINPKNNPVWFAETLMLTW